MSERFKRPESKPVLTPELADRCRPFFRTLKDDCDLQSVANINRAASYIVREPNSSHTIQYIEKNTDVISSNSSLFDFLKELHGANTNEGTQLTRLINTLSRNIGRNEIYTVGDYRDAEISELIELKNLYLGALFLKDIFGPKNNS